MVRTTLSFGTHSLQANHVPGARSATEAHFTSALSHLAIRAVRAATLLSMIVVGAACGGGGDSAEAAPPAVGALDPTPTEPSPTAPSPGTPAPPSTEAPPETWQACLRVPAVAAQMLVGETRRDVRSFGAKPNDDADDSAEIQKALDALKSGETLFFPSGRYLVNRSLRVSKPGVTITGENATLHATNPDDMALFIQADDVTVASMTFTAITEGRRNAPRHARVVINGDVSKGDRVRGTVIRDNRIVNADKPGTPGANAASTGGIMVLHADRFLIAGNTVARTLADGIHITAGSRNGRVLNNVVRETGDDMIAVVSYSDSGKAVHNSAQKLADAWDENVAKRLNRNILIAGNRVSGQYWGRGITVIGGQSVTITRNTIENVTHGAAVLLAREASFQTFGVENVVVEGNLIRGVQTDPPTYDTPKKYTPDSRTGHGAIEVHAALFDDEAEDSKLRGALAVRNVLVRGNTVERSAVSSVRLGVPIDQTLRDGDVSRHARNGKIENVSMQNNRFDEVKGDGIKVMGAQLQDDGVHCGGNQRDGRDYRASACKATEPEVRGVPLLCSADGRLK
jgi:hypothetical protein